MNRQRLILLGVAVLVAAGCVGVVLAFVGTGGKSAATTTSATRKTGTGTTVVTGEGIFKGVPQKGLRLGNVAAPATLYVFEDPQCPYCRDWDLGALPTVVREFVRTGRVRLELQPVEIIGQLSQPGIRAVYAASLQNKAWNMLEALFERQGSENSGWISDAVIRASAKEAGASPQLVVDAIPTQKILNMWKKVEQQSSAWGVNGSPTFILQKQLARPVQLSVPSLDAATFSAALRNALQ